MGVDRDRLVLIIEIEKLRKSIGLDPQAPEYLASKNLDELRDLCRSYVELSNAYGSKLGASTTVTSIRSPKIFSNRAKWIMYGILLVVLVASAFIYLGPANYDWLPNIFWDNKVLEQNISVSISYGFRDNQTVYVIKSERQFESLNITLDGTDANYALISGSLPGDEISVVIDGFFCDNMSHKVDFLIGGVRKTVESDNYCLRPSN